MTSLRLGLEPVIHIIPKSTPVIVHPKRIKYLPKHPTLILYNKVGQLVQYNIEAKSFGFH